MGKAHRAQYDFSGGLQTKAVEDGQPRPNFQTFANVRVSDGSAAARKGMVRVARPGSAINATNFVAASNMKCQAPIDTRVWTLGLEWTLEILLSPDDKTLTNPIIYAGHTTPSLVIDMSSNKWRVRHWDEDATLTTLTTTADALETTTSLQIVRDGTSLLLRVDNGTETTGSVAAGKISRAPAGDLMIAEDASSNNFDGQIDYIRLFSFAKSAHPDSRTRTQDARAGTVRACYDFKIVDTLYIEDRSRFENNLGVFFTPTNTTALAVQGHGVDGIYQYRDSDNIRQTIICSGGQYFHAEV